MILDELLEFADALALNTGAADTYHIGDVVDLGDAPTLQGPGFSGDPIYLVIQVDTAVDSAGDGVTLQFHLASDDSASIHKSTSTRHFSTGVLAQATLVAGYVIAAVALPLTRNYERYLGILQTTAVEAVTAGKINAFLTHDVSSWAALPNAANA